MLFKVLHLFEDTIYTVYSVKQSEDAKNNEFLIHDSLDGWKWVPANQCVPAEQCGIREEQ